ncbi:hypothetical protein Aph01nite_62330 [Acrocarpospora phusangensis]|uniref:Uncharacterized protein n=1 Tax=Acrocarpospora phusangensis TaxID=1070424 RepID=A0A919QFP6_9ACTN|nr:hypothetical protein [Acrocarpospora phusangensis]GIH27923.1 hypothetical protein Aph01nite_62330 [Acrocarpospora phusangensis]
MLLSEVHPEEFRAATEHALASFDAEIAQFADPSDEDVFAAVRRVVEALNEVAESDPGTSYDTIDRENLCDYIENALTESGIDVEALASRRGLHPTASLTDEWRDW